MADPNLSREATDLRVASSDLIGARRMVVSRKVVLIVSLAVLVLAFAPMLYAWAIYVAGSDLHSYTLLIPLISLYLVFMRRDLLPARYESNYGWAIVATIFGTSALAIARVFRVSQVAPGNGDYVSLTIFSFVCFLVAIGFLILGAKWMATMSFPIGFLFFMVPMPEVMVDALETASKLASAEAVNFFFLLSGTPFLRDGTIFHLPDITIQVAQECSGIRSSWILFITSLVAANLFLRTTWRRLFLIAFVVPLGIIRNGFRILVIGLLCVHYGPQMISSPIHRQGGPLFFALSLIPMFLLLWWLRRGEERRLAHVSREVAEGKATVSDAEQQL